MAKVRVTLKDIPNDEPMQVLFHQLKDGLVVYRSDHTNPDEALALAALDRAIQTEDTKAILEAVKSPHYQHRILALFIGVPALTRLTPDQFHTLSLLSYAHEIALPLQLKQFIERDEKGPQPAPQVTPEGQLWLDGLMPRDDNPDFKKELVKQAGSKKLFPIENTITVVELNEIYLVSFCIVFLKLNFTMPGTFKKHNARLEPVFIHALQQVKTFSLNNINIIDELLAIHKTGDLLQLINIEDQFERDHLYHPIFRTGIKVHVTTFFPQIVNGKVSMLIPSSQLFNFYVNTSNPLNKMKYMNSFGMIFPATIEKFARANIRIGNAFQQGIKNPTTAHEMPTTSFWFHLHDWMYHYFLASQLSPGVRAEYFYMIDELRLMMPSKGIGTLTNATWNLVDQDTRWYYTDIYHDLALLLSRNQKDTLERYLLLVSMMRNPKKWPTFQINKDEVAKELLKENPRAQWSEIEKEILKFYPPKAPQKAGDKKDHKGDGQLVHASPKATPPKEAPLKKIHAQDKVAVLIALKHKFGFPQLADDLAEITRQFPRCDWLKWKKAPKDNHLYPVIELDEISFALPLDKHSGRFQSHPLVMMLPSKKSAEREALFRNAFMKFKNKRIAIADEVYNDQLNLKLKSALSLYLIADNTDSKLLRPLLAQGKTTYNGIRTVMPKLSANLQNIIRPILIEWHNQYMLSKMQIALVPLLRLIDDLKYALGKDEIGTGRPVMGGITHRQGMRFNLFHHHKGRGTLKALMKTYQELSSFKSAQACGNALLAVMQDAKNPASACLRDCGKKVAKLGAYLEYLQKEKGIGPSKTVQPLKY